jgi:uncharacterized delta-60 repeat protein
MKVKILALILLFNFTSFLSLNAQWARTYGGSDDDLALSIQQTSDGGYIVAGGAGCTWYSSNFLRYFVDYDFWVLKLTSVGEIEWQRIYGIYGAEKDDMVSSIQQTSDGGYIVTGYTESFDADIFDFDLWVLKLSPAGDIEWQRIYGGDRPEKVSSIIRQTSDGGYIFACSTFSFGAGHHDFWVLKLTSLGEIEWQRTYGGSNNDKAYSIQQASDGGYIVAGETKPFGAGNKDILVLKLASDGNIEWQKTYVGNYTDEAYSIQQASDGGYIVAGETQSFGAGNKDILVLKLASDGTIEWQKIYGGSLWDEAYSIQQASDGGYIVAGETQSFGAGNGDIWILKLASDGTIKWQKTYGGTQSDEASSIQQTGDGGYIVAGSTDSYGAGKRDFLILKLSSNGDIDPACIFIRESNAEVSDAGISPSNTDIIPQDTNITPQDTTITPQDSDALVYSLCSGQHTLSLSAGSGGTTVPQPGTYIYDHAVRISISASPDDGYNFSGWSGNASGTDNPLSITIDTDKSIDASFSARIIEDEWEEVNKSPCLIATAAYGSPLHPHVRILRDFRDKFLMSNKLGREFVELYYKYSPFVANFIAKHKVLKLIVQVNLLSLVIFSYSMVNFGPIATGGILLLIIMIPIFLYFRKFRG